MTGHEARGGSGVPGGAEATAGQPVTGGAEVSGGPGTVDGRPDVQERQPTDGPEPADGIEPGAPSGLRNPVRAVRALGAGTLVLEALALLLAIQPIRLLGGHLGGAAIVVILVLAVLAVLLGGLLGRGWAWPAATALQGLLILAGFLHWSLTALGIVFGLAWVYVLHVRRTILG